MFEENIKRYIDHENLPPFSVGEVKPLRGVGRREVGHGRLAEKALEPVLPDQTDFPYMIRVVSRRQHVIDQVLWGLCVDRQCHLWMHEYHSKLW